MRPVYLHISYVANTPDDSNKKATTYGGSVFELNNPMTTDEIRSYVKDTLSERFGFDIGDIQIMSISVLPKRVYKMLKGIQ
jgi:hypothetical protein